MATLDKNYHKLSLIRKILIIIIISAEAGAVYRLPYLYESFYDQFQALFGITHTQIGLLVSVFGIVGTLCCVVSGVVADRFSPRKMITCGMVLLAICGYIFSTVPPYGVVCLLYGLMAISSGIFFYSASLRALSALEGEDNQGKIYGAHEGLKGVTSALTTAVMLAIVTHAVSEAVGMRFSYKFYSAFYAVLAIASYVVIPDLPPVNKKANSNGIDLSLFRKLLKTPGVWYCMLMIWGWYSVMCLMAYTTPYLTGVFGVGTATMGVIAIIRSYAIGIFAAPIAGVLGSKIKSCSKVTVYSTLLMLAVSLGLLLTPATQNAKAFVIVFAVCVGLSVYLCRGTSWANLPEAGIPLEVVGSATGIISVFAFSPDIYIYTLAGHLIDTYGDTGYRYVFLIMVIMSVIGLFGTFMIRRTQLKNQKQLSAE